MTRYLLWRYSTVKDRDKKTSEFCWLLAYFQFHLQILPQETKKVVSYEAGHMTSFSDFQIRTSMGKDMCWYAHAHTHFLFLSSEGIFRTRNEYGSWFKIKVMRMRQRMWKGKLELHILCGEKCVFQERISFHPSTTAIKALCSRLVYTHSQNLVTEKAGEVEIAV